ncbi:hypothetical protein ACIQD3_16575 [Peribacillus loiseleuriae]|uniref:Uncharacterized protein n=1 Tax=Peribacillus loiseleuriae TaxID=1679170 RepID=A0A0K9GXQ4_9BACI|nr:hypothetical protein [Peribacillus loiseleuriae]KMY51438.1 hypothetical protein AC625_19405 [Peribacillus loiseleuriae]
MTLAEYNEKYESIIRNSYISDRQKALKLADLLTDMEGQINEAGEPYNKEVLTLYKKVSLLSTLL